ncbi:MAG: Molybdopterin adenylyltransferase [Deltaproteobacteria bacterium ADurb.Bin151]|jgi:molybdopterin adenylyltransferase|nr:MAG: Molybdopterin adenylyltransferase [Deltaproteobacteria bacterium ADurb.Bin151]HNZ10124.1 MogA/MoaB family molybdenum cofactor biosynthesis protein [Smithellaceae bacterium]HOG80892.1 MogA/MoaB family molybdenum cofactor biosynthesis protein [Smithellaceae bacterium]HOQ40703.1 MogA/MoaB family molybdenum cofactor biosynthesis protein [Smithellaceae bacterium]HPL65187.1 MogA/MoaB family molybdenum cofactor biosynthesis protein [Smithellaceae bacterium]
MFNAAIITVSDKGSQGKRQDLSGPAIAEMLAGAAIEVKHTLITPDEIDRIRKAIIQFADVEKMDLILTTGGTGVSPRDLTPDATLKVLDKEIPGMAEVMRITSMKITPHAMISRAVAGIRGHSLIINLPGSPKGAMENLAAVLPAIPHAIEKIKGDDRDCAVSP